MALVSDFEPPAEAYRSEIVVTEEHIDELLHVNNLRWIRWVIDVAVAHSRAVGLDIAQYLAMGVIWVVRRQEVDYLAPAHRGERLTCFTWVESYGRVSSIRRSLFVRASDEKPLLQAATTWVLVDLEGRPVDVPMAIIEKLPPRIPVAR